MSSAISCMTAKFMPFIMYLPATTYCCPSRLAVANPLSYRLPVVYWVAFFPPVNYKNVKHVFCADVMGRGIMSYPELLASIWEDTAHLCKLSETTSSTGIKKFHVDALLLQLLALGILCIDRHTVQVKTQTWQVVLCHLSLTMTCTHGTCCLVPSLESCFCQHLQLHP